MNTTNYKNRDAKAVLITRAYMRPFKKPVKSNFFSAFLNAKNGRFFEYRGMKFHIITDLTAKSYFLQSNLNLGTYNILLLAERVLDGGGRE